MKSPTNSQINLLSRQFIKWHLGSRLKHLAGLGVFCGALFWSAPVKASESEAKLEVQSLASEIRRLAAKDDNLGVRVLVRRMATMRKSFGVWQEVRKTLHQYPSCGWDMLWAWEKMHREEEDNLGFASVDELIANGENLMKLKEYEKAFANYQAAAQQINRERSKTQGQNDFLYQSVLHSAGQALFSAGRFDDAYTVYSWISPVYAKIRQVLFERMWAAFRAGKLDLASGAIAAQYSSFWGSQFVEPETYLLQIYIYRKLCRVADLKLVMLRLREFQKRLKNTSFGALEWAKSDPEYFFFARMLGQATEVSSSFVSTSDRLEERSRVVNLIANKFKAARPGLLADIEKVMAYTNLAFSATSKEFPRVRKLPSQEELFRSGKEMWPIDDAEDWLDELGNQIFIGQSECGNRKSFKR